MPRGSGRGTGAQHRRGRSASVASAIGSHAPVDVQLCGACCKDVGDDAIGCDECELWVHGTEMCSGLTLDMIEAIGRYNGAGIKFVCMKCRLDYSTKRGCSPSSSTETHLVELIKHLTQQIKGICNQVQDLKSELKNLRAQPKVTPFPATAPPPDPPSSQVTRTYASVAVPDPQSSLEYRKVVREELRELQEQQKRRGSLVIRGMGADSAADAIHRFETISEHLINQRVTLTDVVKIPSESDLYRGKVSDDSARKLILDSAKQLRNSSRFGAVFIRRDLTFKQRAELRARRAAAATSEDDHTAGSVSRNVPAAVPGSGAQRQKDGPQTLTSLTDSITQAPNQCQNADLGRAATPTDSSQQPNK